MPNCLIIVKNCRIEYLEKYRRMAIELGATDAKVVTKDIVVIYE